jgi:anaerobic magnesium-protoporphyrin IX monomethyl ester cyclase
LYTRLYAFLEELDNISLPTIRSVMKIDYLSKQKFQPRKPWWNNDLNKEEQSKMYKLLVEDPTLAGESFSTLQLNERELYKQTFITPISINVDSFMQGSIEEEEGYLLTTFGKTDTSHLSFVSGKTSSHI